MATITINVDDTTAAEFRRVAKESYGTTKGVLGKAVAEALYEWTKKKMYLETCLKLLREGKDMGKILYKKRDDLHERS